MQQGIGNLAQRPEFGLGDFVSDVFKPVRNVVNKVVPRELKPILPVVAAAFLGPAVGSMFGGLAASSPALAAALGAGTTSALTQAITGSGQIDPTSTLLSAGIGGIQGARIPGGDRFQTQAGPTMPGQGGTGLMPGQGPNVGRTVFAQPGTEAYKSAMDQSGFFDQALMKAKEYTGSLEVNPLGQFKTASGNIYERGPESFLKGAATFSLPYTAKAEAEEAIDLEKAEGLANMELEDRKRKDKKIYIDFVMRAGFTREEAERMAEGAGYEEGGKVMLASDPDPADERNTMRENFAPRLFKGRTLDQLSDDEIIELDDAIEEMTKKEKKEKRMTAQEGDFVSGIEAILNLPNITPTKRPDTEMDEEDEVDAFSERMERLGEDKFVSSGDTMKILRFFSKNPDAEQQYSGQLKDYIEQGKGSNAFFDSVLGSNFSEGGKVPGLPAGKQVDAREGMFIPMGGAKRADDVPAMLSVNEFVLNDNAVAGLGKMLTGTPDPRAGARALYKIQDQLEAMVV